MIITYQFDHTIQFSFQMVLLLLFFLYLSSAICCVCCFFPFIYFLFCKRFYCSLVFFQCHSNRLKHTSLLHGLLISTFIYLFRLIADWLCFNWAFNHSQRYRRFIANVEEKVFALLWVGYFIFHLLHWNSSNFKRDVFSMACFHIHSNTSKWAKANNIKFLHKGPFLEHYLSIL